MKEKILETYNSLGDFLLGVFEKQATRLNDYRRLIHTNILLLVVLEPTDIPYL